VRIGAAVPAGRKMRNASLCDALRPQWICHVPLESLILS
jgi:hypothetical protein